MKKKIEELQKQLDKLKAEFEATQKTKVDFSILNDEDWFYFEFDGNSHVKWFLRNITIDSMGCLRPKDSYCEYDDELKLNRPQDDSGLYVGTKDRVSVLRKATESDLAPMFEKHPELAPVKIGDWGIFWDEDIENLSIRQLGGVIEIDHYQYIDYVGVKWKHFHKIDPNKPLNEIIEDFRKEVK